MLQVKSLILNLFLLVLRIPLDFSSNAGYKGSGFFETLQEKSLEFVSSKRNDIVTFNL